MSMPISYLSLKAVLKQMDAIKRIEIATSCPSISRIEKSVPLHLKNLYFSGSGIVLNGVHWQLTTVLPGEGPPYDTHGVSYGVDEYGRRDRIMDLEMLPGDVQGDKNSIYEHPEITNVDRLIPSFIQLTISRNGVQVYRRPIEYNVPFHIAVKRLYHFLIGDRCTLLVDTLTIDPQYNTVLRVPERLKIRCRKLNCGIFNYLKLRPLLDHSRHLDEMILEIGARRTIQFSGNAKKVVVRNGMSRRFLPDVRNKMVVWEATNFTTDHVMFTINDWLLTGQSIGVCHVFKLDCRILMVLLFRRLTWDNVEVIGKKTLTFPSPKSIQLEDDSELVLYGVEVGERFEVRLEVMPIGSTKRRKQDYSIIIYFFIIILFMLLSSTQMF